MTTATAMPKCAFCKATDTVLVPVFGHTAVRICDDFEACMKRTNPTITEN